MSAVHGTDQQYLAVGAASAHFTNPMSPGIVYRLTANTDCWVAIGASGGAAVASTAGNTLLISGQTIQVRGTDTSATTNGYVHIIRNTADGKATLSPIGPG